MRGNAKRIRRLLAVLFLILPIQAQYGGGTGEPDDPYLIYTAEQMNEISLHKEDQHKHFKLMADINLSAYSGTAFNRIGEYDRAFPGFAGVFDGDGHTISNFTYTTTHSGPVGIFASIRGSNARISNLGLIDPNIDAEIGVSVGPLAGRLKMGTITNCYVEGGKISGKRHVGGLVGINDGYVINCFSSCSIHAEDMVGGLVGKNKGIVMASYSSTDVQGRDEVGGLVGRNTYSGETFDCYAEGEVFGQKYVGGLVGNNHVVFSHGAGPFFGTIRTCYSVTTVSGDEHVGGLIGYDPGGGVHDCFWDIEISGQITSAGGVGKTTLEMLDPNTFINAGWDFVDETVNGTGDIWWILEGQGYPKLWWESIP